LTKGMRGSISDVITQAQYYSNPNMAIASLWRAIEQLANYVDELHELIDAKAREPSYYERKNEDEQREETVDENLCPHRKTYDETLGATHLRICVACEKIVR